jgi:arginine transport system substrate-binding protein
MLKKILMLVSLMGLIFLTSLGFAQSTRQTLRVGIGHFYPPFIYNYSVGFDTDLANALCQQMQAQCSLYSMSLKEMLEALQNNQLDMILSGLSITPERQKAISFTKPYLIGSVGFLGLNQRAYPQSLDNLKIGVIASSTFNTFLASASTLSSQIETRESYGDLLVDLNKGKIDLILLDTAVGNYWVDQSNGQLKMIGSSFQIPFDLGYGIGVQKDNLALQRRLNQALAALVSNGKFAQMVHLYFPNQNEAIIPPWLATLMPATANNIKAG